MAEQDVQEVLSFLDYNDDDFVLKPAREKKVAVLPEKEPLLTAEQLAAAQTKVFTETVEVMDLVEVLGHDT